MNHAIRLTFGVVHGILLTLVSFACLLFVPAFSELLFSLFGCIILPTVSLFLTLVCNACVEYVSSSKLDIKLILQDAWIPPLALFLVALILYPLSRMQLPWSGPLNTLTATAVVVNGFLAAILQVYISRNLQSSEDSSAPGSSAK